MPGPQQSSQGSEGGDGSAEGGLEGIAVEDIGYEDPSAAEGGDMGTGDMAGGSDALPSLEDEELLDMSLEDFEESMADAAAEAAEAAQGSGQGGAGNEQLGDAGEQGQGGGPAGSGFPPGDGSETGQAGGGFPGQGTEQQGSGQAGGGFPGGGQWPGSETGGGTGNGGMTTAEQVAILDAQLEASTGDFDDLILQERETIRRTAKDRELNEESTSSESGGGYGGYGGSGEYQTPPMRGSGSGQGGPGPVPRSSGEEGDFPAQAAVFPPPEDIPSGDDDDVVARQLREAAMRESDPQLREKLWDEYRKYKGIDK